MNITPFAALGLEDGLEKQALVGKLLRSAAKPIKSLFGKKPPVKIPTPAPTSTRASEWSKALPKRQPIESVVDPAAKRGVRTVVGQGSKQFAKDVGKNLNPYTVATKGTAKAILGGGTAAGAMYAWPHIKPTFDSFRKSVGTIK